MAHTCTTVGIKNILSGDEDDLDVDGGEGFEVYTWAGQTRVREGGTIQSCCLMGQSNLNFFSVHRVAVTWIPRLGWSFDKVAAGS